MRLSNNIIILCYLIPFFDRIEEKYRYAREEYRKLLIGTYDLFLKVRQVTYILPLRTVRQGKILNMEDWSLER